MKLSEYLKKRRISASEFAACIGVHKATVGRWISPDSDSRPDWDLIPKIVKATGGAVTANDFVTNEQQAVE